MVSVADEDVSITNAIPEELQAASVALDDVVVRNPPVTTVLPAAASHSTEEQTKLSSVADENTFKTTVLNTEFQKKDGEDIAEPPLKKVKALGLPVDVVAVDNSANSQPEAIAQVQRKKSSKPVHKKRVAKKRLKKGSKNTLTCERCHKRHQRCRYVEGETSCVTCVEANTPCIQHLDGRFNSGRRPSKNGPTSKSRRRKRAREAVANAQFMQNVGYLQANLQQSMHQHQMMYPIGMQAMPNWMNMMANPANAVSGAVSKTPTLGAGVGMPVTNAQVNKSALAYTTYGNVNGAAPTDGSLTYPVYNKASAATDSSAALALAVAQQQKLAANEVKPTDTPSTNRTISGVAGAGAFNKFPSLQHSSSVKSNSVSAKTVKDEKVSFGDVSASNSSVKVNEVDNDKLQNLQIQVLLQNQQRLAAQLSQQQHMQNKSKQQNNKPKTPHNDSSVSVALGCRLLQMSLQSMTANSASAPQNIPQHAKEVMGLLERLWSELPAKSIEIAKATNISTIGLEPIPQIGPFKYRLTTIRKTSQDNNSSFVPPTSNVKQAKELQKQLERTQQLEYQLKMQQHQRQFQQHYTLQQQKVFGATPV